MKCGDKQKEQQIWIGSLTNTGNSIKHKTVEQNKWIANCKNLLKQEIKT